MDIAGALFGLIVLAPVGAAMATAIRLDSPGPVFSVTTRRPRRRTFMMIKFRSMIDGHIPAEGTQR